MHITHTGSKVLEFLIHEVGAGSKAQTEVISQLAIAHQYNFGIAFKEVLFTAIHLIILNLAGERFSADTVTAIGILHTGTIVVERIFG